MEVGGGKCLKRGHKSWGCVRPRVIPNKVTRDSDKVLHNEVRPNSKCLSKSGGQRLAGFISPHWYSFLLPTCLQTEIISVYTSVSGPGLTHHQPIAFIHTTFPPLPVLTDLSAFTMYSKWWKWGKRGGVVRLGRSIPEKVCLIQYLSVQCSSPPLLYRNCHHLHHIVVILKNATCTHSLIFSLPQLRELSNQGQDGR